MKYLIFGSDKRFYASGGINDFLGSENELDDALHFVRKQYLEWWHVVETKHMTIIAGTRNQAYGADGLLDDEAIIFSSEFAQKEG